MIYIALADSQELFREGLKRLLYSCTSINVILDANSAYDLIEKLKKSIFLPDICVLDNTLVGTDCYSLIKEIRNISSYIKILVLTNHVNHYHINKSVNAGANGILSKFCQYDDLYQALVSIYENSVRSFYSVNSNYNTEKGNDLRLTDREIEFLSYCCTDLNYKEISNKMNVSPRTVEGYRNNLFYKFNVNTRTSLVLHTIRLGLVPNFDKLL